MWTARSPTGESYSPRAPTAASWATRARTAEPWLNTRLVLTTDDGEIITTEDGEPIVASEGGGVDPWAAVTETAETWTPVGLTDPAVVYALLLGGWG